MMSSQYSDYFGTVFINRESGTEPDIADGVILNGLIDCIHKITIEKNVFSGHDIMLLTGGHDYTKFGYERKVSSAGGPIYIEEGVWIATRAIIVGPCRIGKHAVIGAGAVVVGDIPSYVIAGGVPAKIIKYIDH